MCSYIGDYAFANSWGNISITVGTEISTVCSLGGSSVFYNCYNLQAIYVPASLVNDYRSAEYWSYYSNYITEI